MGVDGVQDDKVLVDGEAAHLRGGPARLLHLAPVLPDEVAAAGVQGLHDVAGVGEVEDAVVHERGRLRDAGLHAPRPREPQFADVAAVDLVEGAVAPPVEGAPPAQPVGGVGVLEHRVGDRRQLLHLRVGRAPRPEQHHDACTCDEPGTNCHPEPPHVLINGRLRHRSRRHPALVERSASAPATPVPAASRTGGPPSANPKRLCPRARPTSAIRPRVKRREPIPPAHQPAATPPDSPRSLFCGSASAAARHSDCPSATYAIPAPRTPTYTE